MTMLTAAQPAPGGGGSSGVAWPAETYAIVQDGRVWSVETFTAAPEVHPDVLVVPCGADVRTGWSYADGEFAVPVVDQAAVTAMWAKQMRLARDARMAACDWTQAGDAPLCDAQRQAWRTYRQALRDVPAQAGFPADIAWPESPGGAA